MPGLAGQAGWCFHNGSQRDQADGKPRRSFDMSKKRLFEQLDTEELKTIEKIQNIQVKSLNIEKL